MEYKNNTDRIVHFIRRYGGNPTEFSVNTDPQKILFKEAVMYIADKYLQSLENIIYSSPVNTDARNSAMNSYFSIKTFINFLECYQEEEHYE